MSSFNTIFNIHTNRFNELILTVHYKLGYQGLILCRRAIISDNTIIVGYPTSPCKP